MPVRYWLRIVMDVGGRGGVVREEGGEVGGEERDAGICRNVRVESCWVG